MSDPEAVTSEVVVAAPMASGARAVTWRSCPAGGWCSPGAGTAAPSRSREEVAAYLRDPANDPHWIGGLRSARLVTAPPVGLVGRSVRRDLRTLKRVLEDGAGRA